VKSYDDKKGSNSAFGAQNQATRGKAKLGGAKGLRIEGGDLKSSVEPGGEGRKEGMNFDILQSWSSREIEKTIISKNIWRGKVRQIGKWKKSSFLKKGKEVLPAPQHDWRSSPSSMTKGDN